MGFGNCQYELLPGRGSDQDCLSTDPMGGDAYQICDRLIVEIRRNTCCCRAISEYPEPVREEYAGESAAELRDEDNWFAVDGISATAVISIIRSGLYKRPTWM